MSENINKSEFKTNETQNNNNSNEIQKEISNSSQIKNERNKGNKRKLNERNSGENRNNERERQQMNSWIRLTGAPAWDLPPNDTQNQTFTGRCRLFVANLPQNVTEESLRLLFSDFGKISDIYIGKGNQFAFIKMDTRLNAEHAKQSLDGKSLDGRTLRVRLAAHASAIRVTNLPPLVSNELLYLAFSSFGTVERAIVSADDRGRSLNEGIVEFARKSSSQAAIKKCQNECLLLSSSPIPVCVQPLESRDEEEGVLEKSVIHLNGYKEERELGPRFAEQNTLEYELSHKWKQLLQLETQRKESLELEFKQLREELKGQMESFKIEETIKQLREQLRRMELESQKLCHEREQRIELERRREEQRRQTEILLRQQEEQLLRRGDGSNVQQGDLGTLRRQESELRQQANALQQLLDRQEQALRSMSNQSDGQSVNIQGIHSSDAYSVNSQIQQQFNANTLMNAQNQMVSQNQFLNSLPISPQQVPPQPMRTGPNPSQQQQQYGRGPGGPGGNHSGHQQNQLQYQKRSRRF